MQSSEKMFTVDKFVGVNQMADGYSEIRMGEASTSENFIVTDGMNLATRPGTARVPFGKDRDPAPIMACWSGYVSETGTEEYLVVVDFAGGKDRIWLYAKRDNGEEIQYRQDGALGITSAADQVVKIFAFGGKLYIMSTVNTVSYQDGKFVQEEPYIPLVIAVASPSGGGEQMENINLLTEKRRINYSSDGEAKAYTLPTEAKLIEVVKIDGVEVPDAGTWSPTIKVYTFKEPPVKGVGNVEFLYSADPEETNKTRAEILSMPLVEAYNGSTDTRLFVGGKGNVCYYTGVPLEGEVTPMYFPALNFVSVDMTGSDITGLIRHYSKLLVFTRDGTYSVTYEPVTLPGGDTTAGFYLRSINKEFGNDVLGQVQTVNNYPRTVTADGIYEWRITSSYYQDERYAKRVSEKVRHDFSRADIKKIVTCDDNYDKTYYVYLNDDLGTVLVNRYDLTKDQIWCIYHSELFKGITRSFVFDGKVHFTTGTELFRFDTASAYDAPIIPDGEPLPIPALWESGFMDFGANFRRKFSSEIYLSMVPMVRSKLTVTAQTDRRDEYMEKTLESNVFSFRNLDFSYFTFNTNRIAKIQRIRLKVKKFVYYKLVFRVDTPGATAMILSYDQKVRFGSMAK